MHMCKQGVLNSLFSTYRTLMDVSNYSESFANYFLTSNCIVHSKFLESNYLDKT